MDALDLHVKHDTERLEKENHVLALVGKYILAANGAKNAADIEVNLWTSQRKHKEAAAVIKPEVAAIYMNLFNRGKLHPWVISMVDMSLIEGVLKG